MSVNRHDRKETRFKPKSIPDLITIWQKRTGSGKLPRNRKKSNYLQKMILELVATPNVEALSLKRFQQFMSLILPNAEAIGFTQLSEHYHSTLAIALPPITTKKILKKDRVRHLEEKQRSANGN